MKAIGVAGQYGVAKDEVSNFLAKKLSGDWKRIGFAHAVKKVFMDTFDVSWDFIEEWKRKPEAPEGFDMNIRKSLQFIGDGFRGIKSDIWLEIAFRNTSNIILSDVRYNNELKAVKDHGGINILLWRKGYENDDPNPSESQIKPLVNWFVKSGLEGDVRNLNSNHPMLERAGQNELIPEEARYIDFFIRNEGTLEDLYKKVDNMIIPHLVD